MCVRVLTWRATELVRLHHCQQVSAEFKFSSPDIDSGPNGHVGISGVEYSRSDLAITIEVDGVEVTGSSVGEVAEEETNFFLFFFLTRPSGLSVKFSGRLKQLIHYPVFVPYKKEEENKKIDLFKLWLPMLII